LFVTNALPAPETAPTDPCEDRAARRLRVLQELAEIGMDLARALRQRAAEQAAPEAGGDVALAFSRIARAVRQTVALEARLDEDRQARDERIAAEHAARQAELDRRDADGRLRGLIRKEEVREIVERTIDCEARERGDGCDAESLLADLDERLEDDDDYEDFARLPIGELVTRICRDLGVTPDPCFFEDGDWEAPALTPWPPGERYWSAPQSTAHPRAGGDPGFFPRSAAPFDKTPGFSPARE